MELNESNGCHGYPRLTGGLQYVMNCVFYPFSKEALRYKSRIICLFSCTMEMSANQVTLNYHFRMFPNLECLSLLFWIIIAHFAILVLQSICTSSLQQALRVKIIGIDSSVASPRVHTFEMFTTLRPGKDTMLRVESERSASKPNKLPSCKGCRSMKVWIHPLYQDHGMLIN